MQTYEYKQLKVTQLLLNVQNPRFDPVNYQAEAIQAMISDQGEKLIELAKHITSNGLSPMEIILIQPIGEQWLVREGNRRVTALKLINEPELIPDIYPKMKREFSLLNKKIDNRILDNIQCAIISDENLINEWIRLKHTGENKGIGTVSWDAQQTSRFMLQTSKRNDPKSILFEDLRNNENLPKPLKDRFGDIKKTNFDRLIGDPAVRKFLGIEAENGYYNLSEGFNERLLTVLWDLVGDFSVGTIYTKGDRNNYLNEVETRITKNKTQINKSESDQNNPLSLAESHDKEDSTEDRKNTSQKTVLVAYNDKSQKKSYPINRKTLIPSIHTLTITNPRIARIYKELKSIDCEQYPNSVSVLFRVFVELTCDYYISVNHLPRISVNNKLSQKANAIIEYFKANKIMEENDLRAAQQMVSSDTQNQSIKTFHSYVHNINITPTTTDLLTAWDDLFPFIKNLWR